MARLRSSRVSARVMDHASPCLLDSVSGDPPEKERGKEEELQIKKGTMHSRRKKKREKKLTRRLGQRTSRFAFQAQPRLRFAPKCQKMARLPSS